MPSCGMAALDDLMRALTREGGIARVDRMVCVTGLTARSIRAIAQRSRWWCPYRSVVGLPGIEVSEAQAWTRASVLHAQGATGDPARDVAALTRRSALHHLGVTRSGPTRIEVVIPASRRLMAQPRLTVTRSSHLALSDSTKVRGVEVLSGAALIRELAAVRDLERLRADAISLQHAGYLDVNDLAELHERCVRFPGRGAVGRVLRDLDAAGRVDSPLEYDFRQRFKRDGVLFDRGQVAVPVGGPGERPLHLDLGIATIRFGIEVDSMAHHSSPSDLQRDAERRNRLALLTDDWRVLHASYADLGTERWRDLLDRVRTVIAGQSRRYLDRGWPRATDLRR